MGQGLQTFLQFQMSTVIEPLLPDEALRGGCELKQIRPFLKGLTEARDPTQLFLDVLGVKRGAGLGRLSIEKNEHVLSPLDQDIQVHIAGFGPLVGRCQGGEGGLLNAALRLGSQSSKRHPGLIVFQLPFQ